MLCCHESTKNIFLEGIYMNFEQIKKAAEAYRADMSRFLRDMIRIPSESCEEEGVVMCIKAEMEKAGLRQG